MNDGVMGVCKDLYFYMLGLDDCFFKNEFVRVKGLFSFRFGLFKSLWKVRCVIDKLYFLIFVVCSGFDYDRKINFVCGRY